MASSGTFPEKLKPKQARAITALMQERDVRQAATVAKVGERTLWRWLSDPTFRQALSAAESEAIDAATRRLVSLQQQSIDTIEAVLADESTTAGVRLRAATAVLDYLLKLRELRNVEMRLEALELAMLKNEK